MRKISIFFFVIFSFSRVVCGDLSWTAPTTISSSQASDPKVVSDPSANATAAWVENGFVKAASEPFGMSWGSATTLSGSGASSPRLGVDPMSGNVTAIWLEGGVVKSSTFASSMWSAAVSVSDIGGGASSPALAVDASGNAIAVWVRSGFIETATKLFGGSWGGVTVLSSTTSDNPQIAIGSTTAVAVWHAVVSGSNVIQSSSSTVGGSWGTVKTVFQDSNNHNYPQVAVDSNGNAVAVWFRYIFNDPNYSNVNLVASGLPSGGSSWSATPTVLIGQGTGNGKRNPANLTSKVAFDVNGNAIAFWNNSYDEDTFNVESAVLPPGGNWSLVQEIDIQDKYAYATDVVVNYYGDAIAVWMVFDGMSTVSIQGIESDLAAVEDNVWSPGIVISTGTNNGFPKIASTVLSSTTINAVAVWITSDGVNNTIQASNGTRTILGPPSNPAVTQSSNNFGVFTEFFNTITWDASTDPNTHGYVVYRNGVAFAQTDAMTFQVTDDNEIQNGTVTYAVAAIDVNDQQSINVSVTFPSGE